MQQIFVTWKSCILMSKVTQKPDKYVYDLLNKTETMAVHGSRWCIVLVLAGIQLTFFLEAHTMLLFGLFLWK